MKKLYFLLLTFLFSFIATAQESPGVERNLTGIQAGFLGVNIYHEFGVSKEVAIRGGLNFAAAVLNGEFAMIPSASISPKRYYNLEERAEKGRNISHNSGNYVAGVLYFTPKSDVLFNDDYKLNTTLGFMPTWGLRRSFANNFNYEFNIGYGAMYDFVDEKFYSSADLGFKIGYDF